jgi:integrase
MNWNASIYKHPKSNSIYFDLLYNGVRKRKSTKLKKTPKNIKLVEQEILPKIQMSMSQGTFSFENESTSGILEIFADEFFKIYKERVRKNTYYDNYGNYENKVKPFFGKRALKSIVPLELEKWQFELLKNYSESSVVKFRYIFNDILETAYKNDFLENNPFKKVNTPKKKKDKDIISLDNDESEIDPFNAEEIKIMVDNFRGYLGYFVYLMVFTGMRPSEILALEWKDIDFKKKRISVYKAVVKGEVSRPKTVNSERYVDMLPNLEEKLLEWKDIRPCDTYVFVNQSKNRFYGVSVINKVFKKRLVKYGIKERYVYIKNESRCEYSLGQ